MTSGARPALASSPALVALATLPTLSSATLSHLLRHYDQDPEAILAAEEFELRRVRGVGPITATAIRSLQLPEFRRRMACWKQMGVRLLPADEVEYPLALSGIAGAPLLLFVRGTWPPPQKRLAVGIVGTRQPHREAEIYAGQLAEQLAEMGVLVVSGLAAGIDTAAHSAALRIQSSYQLAILGGGVLQIYPDENRWLADTLSLDGAGALLSEYAPDSPPTRSQLVARNRLLAGICDALIVIETSEDGGAMHAARFAQELGRPLFVLPTRAAGNRRLLRTGGLPIPRQLSDLLMIAGRALDERSLDNAVKSLQS